MQVSRLQRSLFPSLTLGWLMLSHTALAPQAAAQALNPDAHLVQCPVPNFDTLANNVEINDPNIVKILSKTTSMEKDKFAIFGGGVTLISNEQTVKADSLEVNRESSLVQAKGNIHFQNQGLNIFASDLTASEAIDGTSLTGARYHLNNSLVNGEAGKLTINRDGELVLTDSTFTTCYGKTPDWQFKASEISISAAENKGEAYNARFEIMDVPVLYIPYLTFPVTNQRKSGFLYPVLSSSSNTGFEIEAPYYWNIRENMDATITPRYMSKRGTQLITEFRYLVDQQFGQIDIEYLNNDKELSDNNDARYLWRAQHVGNFSNNFRAHIDYTSISDDAYLVDLGSKHYNANDAYLYQIGELAYFGDTWHLKLKMQDFELLGNHEQSYRTLPQVEFSNYQNLGFANGIFELYSEVSRFETDDLTKPEASRFHMETGVTFPITTPAWFINSEFKLLQTNYHQDRIENSPQLEETVSRTLPKVRFHGGINLERQTKLFSQSFTQTLEPQLQYLYISSEDQNHIGIYDTGLLQDDYEGLFRDRRFSGHDRIAQANQYSWGLTSRFLDDTNFERMRFSLGRIVYLNDSNFTINEDVEAADKSALAADALIRLNKSWQFGSNIQYNTDLDQTRNSQANLDYKFGDDNMMQLNHRYTTNLADAKLEQLSLLSSVKINNDWRFVGRYTRDLRLGRSIESYAGFQYESCCWAVRIAYHRHINSAIEDLAVTDREEFNSGFMIKFVLKGLSDKNAPIGTQDMFNSSIFGYKRPYFLNN